MPLRLPKLFNLRTDPFENADIAAEMFYGKWRADRAFLLLPAGALVRQWIKTMVEFPPRQRPDTLECRGRAREAPAERTCAGSRLGRQGKISWGLAYVSTVNDHAWAVPCMVQCNA